MPGSAQSNFQISTQPGADAARRLVAHGRLDAAGGELLYCAVELLADSTESLVVDLTAVAEVEPAGWAWLLPILQLSSAHGCRVEVVPPPSGLATDHQPPASTPQIRFYPDGPLLCRGDFTMIDRLGQEIPRRRKVVALCRCGASATKPFCDGSHKLTRFSDES